MKLEELASKTPVERDRYVDFLRAFSIATVVFGHWLIALIQWQGGRIGVRNVVGVTSGLWLATWVFQVMPLFFFVGGFSNLKTLESARRRNEGYGDFLRARAVRLLKPAGVFVAVWLVIQAGFHVFDVGSGRWIRLSFLPFGPLWFLLVYIAVVALTPFMLSLHRRYRRGVVAGLVAGTVIVDAARFTAGLSWAGYLNLALVWLLAHQIGFFYADGSLARAGRKAHALMAAGGLTGLVVLTNIGVYPRSMIGTDVERVSNMNPPTLCIVALTFWLVGLAMLLRPPLSAWLARKRPWKAVIFANSIIMTAFLWHLSAYLLAIVLLYPLGLGRPSDSTVSWWLQRPVWILVPAALLALLVAVFGRFERPVRR